MQPMRIHKFPQLFLLCNGEIYNWDRVINFLLFDIISTKVFYIYLFFYFKYNFFKKKCYILWNSKIYFINKISDRYKFY